jgi:hypothetical protein
MIKVYGIDGPTARRLEYEGDLVPGTRVTLTDEAIGTVIGITDNEITINWTRIPLVSDPTVSPWLRKYFARQGHETYTDDEIQLYEELCEAFDSRYGGAFIPAGGIPSKEDE